MLQKIIAISGGIGSGKSVVSRLLRTMGYEVYDCDSEAKTIMDSSVEMHVALIESFGEDVLTESGGVDRKRLGNIVFSDNAKLKRLNEIVHHAVIEDLKNRINAYDIRSSRRDFFFFETAILFESGLDRLADRIWWVDAPRDIRIERVMKRNNLTRDEVEARISCQTDSLPEAENVSLIANYGNYAVIPQVEALVSMA